MTPAQEPAAILGKSALLARCIEFYSRSFSDSQQPQSLLRDMGLFDSGLLEPVQPGYGDGRLSSTLPSSGDVSTRLQELGILLPDGTERFAGCLILPVFEIEGRPVSLWGWHVTDKKPVLLPGSPTSLWNAKAIRAYSEIVVCQNPLEALAIQAAQHPNAVALFDIATDSDLHLIREHSLTKILFVGTHEWQSQHIPRFKGFPVLTGCLPGAAAPHDILAGKGPDALDRAVTDLLQSATGHTAEDQPVVAGNVLTVRLGRHQYEVRGLERHARKLKATVRTEHNGRLYVDTVDLYSARARRAMIRDLCLFLDEPPDSIETIVSKLLKVCEAHRRAGADDGPAVPEMTEAERQEGLAFGRDKDLLERILNDYESCGLIGENANKLLCYLAAVSRKMPQPLSVMVLSSSGAGKTTLQDATLAFCPPEDVVKLTSVTGRALFYKGEKSLKHRVLALEEEAGAEEATYAIRNLISAGELVIETTTKDLATGGLTTISHRVEGPTAVFITTTNPETDPETQTRFFVISVDESREQTRAILEYQRRRHTLDGHALNDQTSLVLRRHHNFQRLLEPLTVVNPLAADLCYVDDRLQSRRDQPKFLNLIATIAFLRQLRKKRRRSGELVYIEADAADVKAAVELLEQIHGRTPDDLNAVSRDLLNHIRALIRERQTALREGDGSNTTQPGSLRFTRRDIREHTGWPHTRVTRYLKQLVDQEYVLVEYGRNGSRYVYSLAPSPAELAVSESKPNDLSSLSTTFSPASQPENRHQTQ